MSAVERTKLNKETLEASLVQIEYLKGVKKDQINGLVKLLENKCTAEDLEEYERLFKSLDAEEKNEMPASQLGTVLRILQQVPTENEVNLFTKLFYEVIHFMDKLSITALSILAVYYIPFDSSLCVDNEYRKSYAMPKLPKSYF